MGEQDAKGSSQESCQLLSGPSTNLSPSVSLRLPLPRPLPPPPAQFGVRPQPAALILD